MQTYSDTDTSPSSAPINDDVNAGGSVLTQMEKYHRDISAIADTLCDHATALAVPGRPAEDAAQACKLLESASTLGHLPSTFHLSLLLYSGVPGFIPCNVTQSIVLLETAIDKGYVDAMYVLGHYFHFGTLPPSTLTATTTTTTTSHDQGASATTTQQREFKVQQQGCDRAKQLYERARSHGHVKAVTALGMLLEHGGKGVAKDIDQARRMYEEAAGQGEVNALWNLAWAYERGNLGVMRDVSRAVALYVHAARKGCQQAVGRLHELAPGEVERLGDSVTHDSMQNGRNVKSKDNSLVSPRSVSMTTARKNELPVMA